MRPTAQDDMQEFMLVVRRALLLVVRWIERRYGWQESPRATYRGKD